MNFGRAIQAWRKQQRISQSQAAKQLGVSIDTLQNWEQGRYAPRANWARQAILDKLKPADPPQSRV